MFSRPRTIAALPCAEPTLSVAVDLCGDQICAIVVSVGKELRVYCQQGDPLVYELLEIPVALTPITLAGTRPTREFVAVLFPRSITVVGFLDPQAPRLSSLMYHTLTSTMERREEEVAALMAFTASARSADETAATLRAIRQEFPLSPLGQQFLALPSPGPDERQHPLPPILDRRPNTTQVDRRATRATLLDGMTEMQLRFMADEVSCVATLAMATDSAPLRHTLVIGTTNKRILIYDDTLAGPLGSIALPEIPIHIQVEGVANPADIHIPRWRLTILGDRNTVYSVRGMELSQNVIRVEPDIQFVHRVNKSVFLVVTGSTGSELWRVSVKGRHEQTYPLPSPAATLAPLVIELGKPFTGFTIGLKNGAIVYVSELGVTQVAIPPMELDQKSGPYRVFLWARVTKEPETSLVYASRDMNILTTCTLRESIDLGKVFQSEHYTSLQDKKLEVEDIVDSENDKEAEDSKKVDVEEQKRSLRLFLNARAHTKAAVQAAITAGMEDDTTNMLSVVADDHRLIRLAASVGINGVAITIVTTVFNVTNKVFPPSVILIRPKSAAPILPCLAQAHTHARVPALPPQESVQRHFALLIPDELRGRKLGSGCIVTICLVRPQGCGADAGNALYASLDVELPNVSI
ncbi:hypothetical protein GMRT_10498 [Giardia muris]|uniref:Bardet-Biedl syndrome 1 N-terminal domain-containing protein n=1 Tax=Giardia muris TaxID=5742 RepID=A0A4Z1T270_GIAMU|nr:hypothetical protein GMRT_10498 [Giardia muris]|eukprot:TNJ26511.1 hypothetical protein GMRT_10498 [Giardia muris]